METQQIIAEPDSIEPMSSAQRPAVSGFAIAGIVAYAALLAVLVTMHLLPLWLAAAFFVAGIGSGWFALNRLNQTRQQLFEKDRALQALQDKVEQLARHDPLTSVLNRSTLIEMLEAELQRAHRTGHPFSFAIIDLDHFKEINEKFGHPAGDAVLKEVSHTAIKLLRVLDRFGRLGGEEFGIIMPATWLDQSMIAMQRLRNAVAERHWERIATGLNVTFSAGVTTNATGDTAESMTTRAEKALYQAKRDGRNCTVQVEQPLPDMPSLDSI